MAEHLVIHIDKGEGVELSADVVAALENLAQAIAAGNEDEVSGFGFGSKSPVGFDFTRAGAEQWKICWGGYAKTDGGDECATAYFNSEGISVR